MDMEVPDRVGGGEWGIVWMEMRSALQTEERAALLIHVQHIIIMMLVPA